MNHKKAHKAQKENFISNPEVHEIILCPVCLFVAKVRQQIVAFLTSKSSLSLTDR
jgi:hypothetical protein